MPKRMNGGLAVAAVGAGLLIVSLFLDWFAPGRSAWTVFELNDLVLALIGALVVGVAVADAFARPGTERLVPEGSVVYAGIGALIIVVANLIQPPPTAVHSSREIGAWLALAAALLITSGGFLMRARISLVISLREANRPRRAARAEDVAAYEPTEAAYEPAALDDEELAPETFAEEEEPGTFASAEPPPEEYEPEEPDVDPDTETRQFSEPPG